MKGGWVNLLSGRQLPLTLMAFIFTIFVIWALEKTSQVAPANRLEMPSPENLLGVPPFVDETTADMKRSLGSSTWDIRSTVSENNTDPVSNDSGYSWDSIGESAQEEPLNHSKQINQDCNYNQGKWVPNKRRPLYSGFGCKQWLSPMWACRLTQRLDFAYESFRWQPESCKMPNFDGSSFLRRMANKTIAMVGDSLGRQQFQSLMCMITGGEERSDVEDIGWEYGLIIPRGAIRPDGWAYRFPDTNTTILFYWSASLCELEPLSQSKRRTDFAMHLDRPVMFLQQYLHRFDVLILNTGHHWNTGKLQANRWIMYMNGAPIENSSLVTIPFAKNFTVHSVIKWLDSQLPHHPKLKAFFRTLSPRHFFNGDWNTGGTCDNTVPLSGGSKVLQTNSNDLVAESAVIGTRVRLLDITGLSSLRDEGHISRYSIKATPGVQDCLHWCLPGVPDAWNEILFALL